MSEVPDIELPLRDLLALWRWDVKASDRLKTERGQVELDDMEARINALWEAERAATLSRLLEKKRVIRTSGNNVSNLGHEVVAVPVEAIQEQLDILLNKKER